MPAAAWWGCARPGPARSRNSNAPGCPSGGVTRAPAAGPDRNRARLCVTLDPRDPRSAFILGLWQARARRLVGAASRPASGLVCVYIYIYISWRSPTIWGRPQASHSATRIACPPARARSPASKQTRACLASPETRSHPAGQTSRWNYCYCYYNDYYYCRSDLSARANGLCSTFNSAHQHISHLACISAV